MAIASAQSRNNKYVTTITEICILYDLLCLRGDARARKEYFKHIGQRWDSKLRCISLTTVRETMDMLVSLFASFLFWIFC